MAGKIVIKHLHDNEYDISLKTGNGEIFLTHFTCKANTTRKNGIESVKTNSSEEGR